MRTPLIAGNWKMNLDHATAIERALKLRAHLPAQPRAEVLLCPTLVSVAALADALRGSPIQVGGQTCAAEEDGAFTGEVSAKILASAGARAVLVGHSERRTLYGETDDRVRQKVERALAANLTPIICVGEILSERDAGVTLDVVQRQAGHAIDGLSAESFARLVFAYEPVWAIGTGRVATPEQAEEVHAALRSFLRQRFSAAAGTRILYGGSVKADNIDGLMQCQNIDGALVGGASLDPTVFARIVQFEGR